MEQHLTLTPEHDGDEATLHAAGEIDLANVALLLSSGRRLLAEAHVRTLVLDLTQVTFIDSAGIGVCVKLLKSAEAEQRVVRVHLRTPAVIRTFTTMGLLEAFDVRLSAG